MQPVQQQSRPPQAHAWAAHQAMPGAGQASSAPRRSAALNEALRRCHAGESAGLVLALPAWPQMAASLLEEAANIGGGLVWRPSQGDLWLLGTTPGAARRALALFVGMAWPARLLLFPADVAMLETALEAEDARPAAAGAEPAAPLALPPGLQPGGLPPGLAPGIAPGLAPGLAGLEAQASRLPAGTGHALATIWRMEAGAPALLAQRWMIDPAALATPPGRDWAGHAGGLLAARLMGWAASGTAWPAGRKRNLPLLLDMPWIPPPPSLPAPPAGGEGHALVLPLAAACEAADWAALAAAHGWRLAWSGLGPAVAHLATPELLPGCLYFADYSAPVAAAAWPAPDRLVLTGAADRTALAFAMAHGIALCSRMA